jgi:antitoxin component YwqK of YwqJK toxin-antitoxin module
MAKFSFFILAGVAAISCNKSKQTENTSENKLAPINNNFKPNVLKDTIGGIYHEYYKNGNIKVKGVYKNKKRDGDWSYFYENGKLWSYGEYTLGVRNGASSVYFENGVLKMEGNYFNNKQVGLWKFYNEKGKLIKEVQM